MWLLSGRLFIIAVLSILRIKCCVEGTNLQSQVIELNDRFLQVKDDGLWFVDVWIMAGFFIDTCVCHDT